MTELIPFQIEGLDVDEVERLMFEHEGDIGKMAKALHVRSDRLRAFCLASSTIRNAQRELEELAVDESITIIRRLLRSDSMQNAFYASKEFLRSTAGRRRGFGSDVPMASVEVKDGNRRINITWLDPESTPEPKVIDGDVGE